MISRSKTAVVAPNKPNAAAEHSAKKRKRDWTEDEEERLYEACVLYGSQWDAVSSHLNRGKDECTTKWRSLCPSDWKSFSTLPWPDDDIFQLLDAVRQSQFDATVQAHSPTKPIHWLTVAALMNVHEWRYNADECCAMWKDVSCLPASRLGAFSEAEDWLILKRVRQFGTKYDGMWRQLGDELKRHYRQLSSRWQLLQLQRQDSSLADTDSEDSFSQKSPCSEHPTPGQSSAELSCVVTPTTPPSDVLVPATDSKDQLPGDVTAWGPRFITPDKPPADHHQCDDLQFFHGTAAASAPSLPALAGDEQRHRASVQSMLDSIGREAELLRQVMDMSAQEATGTRAAASIATDVHSFTSNAYSTDETLMEQEQLRQVIEMLAMEATACIPSTNASRSTSFSAVKSDTDISSCRRALQWKPLCWR